MGEMADYVNDAMFDEYSGEFGDYYESFPRHHRRTASKACAHCGAKGLKWREMEVGVEKTLVYLLVDKKGKVHECAQGKAAAARRANKVCRTCGASGLHWAQFGANGRWMLAEKDGNAHGCPTVTQKRTFL